VIDVPAGLTHLHSGKVRDLYRTDDGRLLMVASDRISAYDHVLSPTIPDKGRILTAMTVWWFGQLESIVRNHMLSVDDPVIPPQLPPDVVQATRDRYIEAYERLTGLRFADWLA
jgi:phosphoribosylaminoimidazole-succinocarboxamide synthase